MSKHIMRVDAMARFYEGSQLPAPKRRRRSKHTVVDEESVAAFGEDVCFCDVS